MITSTRQYLIAALTTGAMMIQSTFAQQTPEDNWNSPDRAARVAALIPGRKIPDLNRESLFAEWTRQQVESWERENPSELTAAERYKRYAESAPTDDELLADFPRHLAPLARVRGGTPTRKDAAANAMISYCPFCQSQSLSLVFDRENDWHGTTSCCKTELYGRAQDAPGGYQLHATEEVGFLHLDDTVAKVPCTIYTDQDGVVWELFVKTLFDQRRWLDIGGARIVTFAEAYQKTGDPVNVHKLAVLLDAVADTYYGLPLVYRNEILPLSRAEWEASPRPNVFSVGPLGPWNRRFPNFNRGWLNMGKEHIWAEPFALARHHPAFRQVSIENHGDPEALDRKITDKLIRELCLTFKSVFSQKLQTNYQDAIYIEMILMAVLAEDELLAKMFSAAHEVTLYNHTYRDGLNGEGAPNYMAMPGGYFLPYLAKADGWLRFQPGFIQEHPFYQTAVRGIKEMNQATVRGLPLEFGDQHIAAWPVYGLPPADTKRKREAIGSRNWADYGVGILRVGGPDRRLEIAMDYTRATLHNGQDALSIESWVDGIPVMRHGGYACWWWSPQFDWNRPEFQALAAMDFPRRIMSADNRNPSWSWDYTHSSLCHNTPNVDGKGTGLGWGSDDRGYGEVITFKGGEAAGTPGADFQILDVQDRYAWPQVGVKSEIGMEFRRTLIGIETPEGRPYALDLLKLAGGAEHTLFNSAWAERVGAVLPEVAAQADNLEEVLPGGGKHRGTDVSYLRQVGQVERHQPSADAWEIIWKTDFAAYAPRKADGSFVRPMPEDDGKVRLRLMGFNSVGVVQQDSERFELISAKGPWIARLRQPLPEGRQTDGYVAFEKGLDFLIERRGSTADGKDPMRESLFIHILEGFREGEESFIRAAELLDVNSLEGMKRDRMAVKLTFADGATDVVLYQSARGALSLPDGTQTDARYALIRRDANGKLAQVEICRGSFLRGAGLDEHFADDLGGDIVDIIGDLTGTRHESALIVRSDTRWPEGEALHGRQLLIQVESDLREWGNEGYRIEKVTNLPGGLVRLDLQDHAPFIESWHDVFDILPDKPGTLRTPRPMSKHSNNPWYDGMGVWFPEKNLHYTIKSTQPMSGGRGGVTIEFTGAPDLQKAGVVQGDWFVIHAIRPGLKVDVASEWRWFQRSENE